MSKSLGISKEPVFRHQNSTACRACQNLGVFEEHKDFGHTLYQKIPSLTPVKILGFFIQPRFWTLENPWPVCLFKISGFFKEYKDFRFKIKILGVTPVKILGFLMKRTMFFDTKNSWPTWLVKISGFLKSVKILGLHCIKIRGLTPVKILGYFSRNQVL